MSCPYSSGTEGLIICLILWTIIKVLYKILMDIKNEPVVLIYGY